MPRARCPSSLLSSTKGRATVQRSTTRPSSKQSKNRNGSSARQELLKLTFFEKLRHDIAAADELASDVQLRNGGPVRILLDAVAHRGVGKHVHVLEVRACFFQDLHDLRGKSALREQLVPLHEQHHTLAVDHALN